MCGILNKIILFLVDANHQIRHLATNEKADNLAADHIIIPQVCVEYVKVNMLVFTLLPQRVDILVIFISSLG